MIDMTETTVPSLLLRAEAASVLGDALSDAHTFLTRQRDERRAEVVELLEPRIAAIMDQLRDARAEEQAAHAQIDRLHATLFERAAPVLATIRAAGAAPAAVTPEHRAFSDIFETCGGVCGQLPGLDGDALFGCHGCDIPGETVFTDVEAEVLRTISSWVAVDATLPAMNAFHAAVTPAIARRRLDAAVKALLEADGRDAAEAAADPGL